MSFNKNLFLFFLAVVLFSSCVVEKRRYMSGYHITWNERVKAEKNSEATIESLAEDSLAQVLTSEINETETEKVLESPQEIEKEIVADNSHDEPIIVLVKKSIQKHFTSNMVDTNLLKKSDSEEVTNPNEVEKKRKKKKKLNTKRLGIISLIESVLAWVVFFIVVSMIINGAGSGAIFWMAWLAFLFALNGFIGGLRVLKNSKAGKKKTGRMAAIFALVIGGSYLFLVLLARLKAAGS